jgi:ribosomal protein S18 acetylase RimI-like enzyme
VPLKIRTYQTSDQDAVLKLAEKYASWDTTPTLADVQGFHASDPDFFLVAELDHAIVGFIYSTESKHTPTEILQNWKARKVGSIETLAVEVKFRRRGFGTLLLKKLLELFKDRGIDTVTLSVPASEAAAQKLYEKFGFETRGYFLRKKL